MQPVKGGSTHERSRQDFFTSILQSNVLPGLNILKMRGMDRIPDPSYAFKQGENSYEI